MKKTFTKISKHSRCWFFPLRQQLLLARRWLLSGPSAKRSSSSSATFPYWQQFRLARQWLFVDHRCIFLVGLLLYSARWLLYLAGGNLLSSAETFPGCEVFYRLGLDFFQLFSYYFWVGSDFFWHVDDLLWISGVCSWLSANFSCSKAAFHSYTATGGLEGGFLWLDSNFSDKTIK